MSLHVSAYCNLLDVAQMWLQHYGKLKPGFNLVIVNQANGSSGSMGPKNQQNIQMKARLLINSSEPLTGFETEIILNDPNVILVNENRLKLATIQATNESVYAQFMLL